MKKLLSAVTSAVMTASLMTSAFASVFSVSAAGSISAEQPNAMNGAIDDAAISSDKNNSACSFTFDKSVYEIEAGKSGVIKVMLDTNGKLVSGVDIAVAIEGDLRDSVAKVYDDCPDANATYTSNTLSDYVKAGKDSSTFTAMNGALVSLKANAPIGTTNSDGTYNSKAISPDEYFLRFAVKVPEGTPAGDYAVTIPFVQLAGNRTDGETIDSISLPTTSEKAVIRVPGDGETPTKAPTTESPQPDGDYRFYYEKSEYTATPGSNVDMRLFLDTGSNLVSGVEFSVLLEGALRNTVAKIYETSPSASCTFMTNKLEVGSTSTLKDKLGNTASLTANAPIGTANSNGTYTSKAISGDEYFLRYIVSIPENCPTGDYKVTIPYVILAGNRTDGNTIDNPSVETTVGTAVIHVEGAAQPTQGGNIPDDGCVFTFDKDVYEVDASEKDASAVIKVMLDTHGQLVSGVDIAVAIEGELMESVAKVYDDCPDANATYTTNTLTNYVASGKDASTFVTKDGTLVSLKANAPIGTTNSDGTYKSVAVTPDQYFLRFAVKVPQGTTPGDYAVTIPFVQLAGNRTDGETIDSIDLPTTKGSAIIRVKGDAPQPTEEPTTPVINGKVTWDIADKVEATPGKPVTVDVLVDGDDALSIAGAKFGIKYESADGKITYSTATGSTAYDADLERNDTKMTFAFGGTGVAAAKGSKVASITFMVDKDCAAGEYAVNFAGTLYACDAEGNEITKNVTFTGGSILVKESETVPAGNIAWDIEDQVKAKPGDTVTVNVLVSDEEAAKLAIAGAQFEIAYDNADGQIAYVTAEGSDAYDASLERNDTDLSFAFAGDKGVAAADGAKVFALTFTVSEDCAGGEYPITWTKSFITDENDNDITKNVTLIKGSILVEEKAEEETTAPAGNIIWDLEDQVKAKPGDTVTVNALVSDETAAALAIAGAQFGIKFDNADGELTYVTAEGSTAYDSTLERNDTKLGFAFANDKGVAAADGATIIAITFTVSEKCAAGEYEVAWDGAAIIDAEGNEITKNVTFKNGSILVEVDETEAETEPETDAPETEAPETEAPETDAPETDAPETDAPETDAPETDAPETEAPETDAPETDAPETDAPETDAPETDAPETDAPETDAPETTVAVDPGLALWEIIGTTVTASADDQTITIPVKVTNGDPALMIAGATFKIVTPDGIEIEAVVGTPYGSSLVDNNLTKSEFAFVNTNGENVSNPDGDMFTITLTIKGGTGAGEYVIDWANCSITDADGNDISNKVITKSGTITIVEEVTDAPETDAPETDAPETDAPETDAPETDAPETDAPETDAPETDAPETDAPETDAPETDAPETDTPETDAPETDAPETDAPETDAPETSSIVDPGFALWEIIGTTITASADDQTITIPVRVTNGDPALTISGATFTIVTPDGIVIEAVVGTPYGSDLVDNNLTKSEFAFINPNGEAVSNPDGDMFTITLTVKGGTGAGEYVIDWANCSITDADGNDVSNKVITKGGTITIVEEVTEPETDAPETDAPETDAPETDAPETDAPETDAPETDAPETDAPETDAPETDAPETDAPETDAPETSIKVDPGFALWEIIGTNVTASDEDQTITIPVRVTNGDPALTISGATFTIVTPDGIVIEAVVGTPYGSESVDNNLTKSQFAFNNPNGEAVSNPDGDLFEITLTIKGGTLPGDYKIDWDNCTITDADGNIIDGKVILKGGVITVEEAPAPETTAEEPETTVEDPETTIESEETSNDASALHGEVTTESQPSTEGGGGEFENTTEVAPETTDDGSDIPNPETTDVAPASESVYYEIENPIVGYYFSHDYRSFNKGQLGKVYKHTVNENGVAVGEKVDVTAEIDFADQTPEKLYADRNTPNVVSDFEYDVNLYINGEQLLDVSGNPITVKAYIGVKGDVNLDNTADAVDASFVLTYYAKVMTGKNPDTTKLYFDDNNLDNLSAFLGDVTRNEYEEGNFKTEKTAENNTNGSRVLDSVDASFILSAYAKHMTNPNKEWHVIWTEVLGKDNVLTAN